MRQYINLYRSLQAAAPSPRPALILLGVCLLAMAGLAVSAFMAGRDTNRLQAESQALGLQLKQSQGRLADLVQRTKLQKGAPAAEAAVSALQARLKARDGILQALNTGKLGNRDGFSEYMRALARQAGQGVWITGLSVGQGGATLGFSGRALDAERIPAYLGSLHRETIFQGRSFAALRVRQVEEIRPGEAKAADKATAKPAMVEFTLGSERESDNSRSESGGAR